MANVRPPTRSLGTIRLPYSLNGVSHTTGVRVVFGQFPFDFGIVQDLASSFARQCANVVTNETSFATFELHDYKGALLYGGPLLATYPGLRGNQGGIPKYRSRTFTLTGRGIPQGAGYAAGETRTVLFVSDGYVPIAGGRKFSASLYPGVLSLYNFLQNHAQLGADFYGQKATYRAQICEQFNAYAQKRNGN